MSSTSREQERKVRVNPLAPFESASANRYIAQLRNEFGNDTAKRFEVAYIRLGPSADPFEIFSKIKKEEE